MNSDDKKDSLFKDYSDSENLKSKNLPEKNNFFVKINDNFKNNQNVFKILFLFGILALVFGFWNIFSNIKNAFVVSPIVLEDKSKVIENLNRLKDTDGDGISDYEEKNVYGTSPYLVDTDSDGIPDNEEILMPGEICNSDDCQEEVVVGRFDDVNIVNSEIISDTDVFLSLEEMRNFLIQSGYPEEEVNQLTQEDLNLIYQEVEKVITDENYQPDFNQGIINNNLDSNLGNKTLLEEELTQLKNLPIEQVRELLIQNGATAEQLAEISDTDLRSLYEKTLNEINLE